MKIQRFLYAETNLTTGEAFYSLVNSREEAKTLLKDRFEQTFNKYFGDFQIPGLYRNGGSIEYGDDTTVEGCFFYDDEWEIRKHYGFNHAIITSKIEPFETDLTYDELEASYRFQERRYLEEAAVENLYHFLGINPDFAKPDDLAKLNSKLQETYGFSLEDALDKTSDKYVIDDLVDMFVVEDNSFTSEETTWQNVVFEYLKSKAIR